MFDPEPALSCWTSGWWWLYAFLALLGGLFLMMCTLQSADLMGSLAEPSNQYPATQTFGWIYSLSKVLMAMVSVALGTRHATLSLSVLLLVQISLIAYLLIVRPYCHNFMNRFMAYGAGHSCLAYVSALYTLALRDPTDDGPVAIYLYCGLGMVAMYALGEVIYCAMDNPLSPKWHTANRFREVYRCCTDADLEANDEMAKTMLNIYAPVFGDGALEATDGLPLDKDGKLCFESGEPAVLVSNFTEQDVTERENPVSSTTIE